MKAPLNFRFDRKERDGRPKFCEVHGCDKVWTHKHSYNISRKTSGAKMARISMVCCEKHFKYLERAERSWKKTRDLMIEKYAWDQQTPTKLYPDDIKIARVSKKSTTS